MQLWPRAVGRLRGSVWHRPEVHTSEPVQSLLRMHVPPTSIFFAELQQLQATPKRPPRQEHEMRHFNPPDWVPPNIAIAKVF